MMQKGLAEYVEMSFEECFYFLELASVMPNGAEPFKQFPKRTI